MIWDRRIIWRTTGDPRTPWDTEMEGKTWKIRINEFPSDDHIYTLLVDGEDPVGFSEWPQTWVRTEAGARLENERAKTENDPHERAAMNAELEWLKRVAAIEPSDKVN
jgi:hypothetical protein